MAAASQHGRPNGSGIVWPSARTVYALRACSVLATCYPERKKANDIAREAKVPLRFLSQILGELRNAKLVEARRGHAGGYALGREPSDVTVAEVASAVHGYELFAPVPPHRASPRLQFIDELQRRLRDLACDALESTSIADIKPRPAAVRERS